MDQSMQQVLEAVLQAASTVLIVLIGLAAKKATSFLEAKKISLQKADDLASTDYFIKAGIGLVQDFVNLTEQTVVGELKEKSADGRLTKEEAEEVFEMTKNNIMGGMSNSVRQAITAVYGDVDTFIGTQIESIILKNRKAIPEVILPAAPVYESTLHGESDPPSSL